MEQKPATRIGRLHVITDFRYQQRYSHTDLCRMAVDGGADTVQFRQKHGSDRLILDQVVECAQICRDARVCFIVDDRIAVALAAKADGVHVGLADFPIPAVRRILPVDMLIGATAPDRPSAERAEAQGAAYIGFGPVSRTMSKDSPLPTRKRSELSDVCRAVHIPVIAIGGVTAESVPELLNAGAHGVAVMSGVSLSDSPFDAVKKFRRAMDAAVSR